MEIVRQLQLELHEEPPALEVPGIALRTFRDRADIDLWLDLRHRAFARQRVGVRAWTRSDFERELFAKPWWRSDRVWFAEAAGETVGMVTLAQRGNGPTAVPVVHWLAVLPAWRRRGIGALLMNAVHRAVWTAGTREVRLETHAGWTAAVRLYESLGYQSAKSQAVD
ncbi:MAG TPA: GNAT family N-acetyltransferase [Pirellulales bacterium]|nr:GNAT family N-acetyltransferase [Pirellulales bacterium]